jgi:hypothetical protein
MFVATHGSDTILWLLFGCGSLKYSRCMNSRVLPRNTRRADILASASGGSSGRRRKVLADRPAVQFLSFCMMRLK